MTAHPYKRTAFLAGAATLALAVTACGNDGDMADVIQGKASGTASAVSGGTTEVKTTETTTTTPAVREGRWLGDGEPLTVDLQVQAQGEVSPQVRLDELSVSNAVAKRGYYTEYCADVSGHYNVTQKANDGQSLKREERDTSNSLGYIEGAISQFMSLGFEPEGPGQFTYNVTAGETNFDIFDVDKQTFSITLCAHADTTDSNTLYVSLGDYGIKANKSDKDSDILGWELDTRDEPK